MDKLDGEIVAEASGQKPDDTRWTVLTILLLSGGAIVAEIVGESTVEGEERRVRRAGFESVNAALDWGAFNQTSALYGELRRKAMAWLEERAGKFKIDAHSPGGPAAVVSVRLDDGQFERAIELLREIVRAVSERDEDGLETALDAADNFLAEIDRAAG